LLLLLGAIPELCQAHHLIAAALTNCKVNRLALPSSYVTPYNPPPLLSIYFFKKYENAETSWKSIVNNLENKTASTVGGKHGHLGIVVRKKSTFYVSNFWSLQ
jgi:hypothetical protein